jgi:3',5'-cyclic AMP phosphodiesterase CpdA
MAGRQRAAGREVETLQFIWLSDPHLSGAPELEAFRRRFAEAVVAARSTDPAFTLITGDLVDQADSVSYALFRHEARELPGPVHCLPGNHDVGEKRFEAAPPGTVVTSEMLARYREAAGPTWYAFEACHHQFLVLTSSLFGSGLPEEATQWDWLERELARSHGFPTYLAFHHPLYLESPDEPGGTYWNVEPRPRARLFELIEKYGVRAVFTGHVHRSLRHCYRGTRLLTQTAVSFGLGVPEERVEGWSLVTLRDGEPELDFRRLTPGGVVIREQD